MVRVTALDRQRDLDRLHVVLYTLADHQTAPLRSGGLERSQE